MIRISLAGVAAADRLIEALYVAAGRRPGTRQALEWHALAFQIETGIDALPTRYPFGDQAEPGVPCHESGRPLHDGNVHTERTTEAGRTAA